MTGLDRRLESVENELDSGSGGRESGDGPAGAPITAIEYRDADPRRRPEGMEYDRADGYLAYDFWHAQREALSLLAARDHDDAGPEGADDGDADADLVAFLGGYRSGKSVTGARWVLTEAIRYPGSRWLAMGVSYSEASGTTYRTLFEALPGERTHLLTSSFNGPEESPIVADYNRQEHRLTLINDSVIILGSADKWSRYAGDEYAGAWIDEPSHYGPELYDLLEMLGTRLTAPVGPKQQFWTLTGNGFNAAWSILEKREDTNGDPIALLKMRYGGTIIASQ